MNPASPASLTMRFLFCSLILLQCCFGQQRDSLRPASQNPSPMQERTRKHERVRERAFQGLHVTIPGVVPKPVDLFVPQRSLSQQLFDLVIHFHGAVFIVHHAAMEYPGDVIAATVNLGSGSRVYEAGFADSMAFDGLLKAVADSIEGRLGKKPTIRRVSLTAFSAGYGAVRQILGSQRNYEKITGVLLLDGIHSGYIPERRVLAEGGLIDSTGLQIFLELAEDAATPNSGKKFLLTHSEIFPGTFVSTTEAADYLLGQLRIPREPVLDWGPLGMQQLSETRKDHFAVLGFAGNTALDHIDHFHALSFFLLELLKL